MKGIVILFTIGIIFISGCKKEENPTGPKNQQPALGLSADSLFFTNTSLSKTLKVFNRGGGTVSWSLAIDSSFVTSSQQSGSNASDTTYIIITINPSVYMLYGFHYARLSFTSGNQLHYVRIIFHNDGFPILFSAYALYFDNGGDTTFFLRGNSDTPFTWSVFQKPQWLLINPSSGSLARDSVMIHSTVDTAVVLPTGFYQDTITFRVDNYYGKLPTSLNVTPSLVVDNTSLHFGSTLQTLSFTMRNDGLSTLSYSIERDTLDGLLSAWISSISDAQGVLAPRSSRTIFVSVDRNLLPAGYFTRYLNISSGSSYLSSVNVIVEKYQNMPQPLPGSYAGVTTNGWGTGAIYFAIDNNGLMQVDFFRLWAYVDGQLVEITTYGPSDVPITQNSYGGWEVSYHEFYGAQIEIDAIFISSTQISCYYRQLDRIKIHPQLYVTGSARFEAQR